MRVLHVAPSLSRRYGGPTESLWGYAAAAQRAGADVSIAVPRFGDEELAPGGTGAERVDVRVFRGVGRGAFVAAPRLWAWLDAEGGRFDAIHVHGLLNPVSSLATRTAIRRGWPVIQRPFGMLSRYTFQHRRSALKRAFLALVEGPNLRHSSALHFTTDSERDEARWHGIPFEGRQFVIPPPLAKSLPPGNADSVRGASVVVLARLNPIKHLELLLEAWPLVRREVPDATLTIAGDGDPAYVRRLTEMAQAPDLAGSVRFPGFVTGTAKERLLRDARAFALTSYHENFGMAVVEAVAAGVPVVVTPEVQTSGWIARHTLGRVVDRTPAAVAAGVVSVLRDDVLARRCQVDGARLVREWLAPERIGAELLHMYEAVAVAR